MACHEGKFGELLADLAVHKLDMVLADSPVHPGLNVRAFNHLLGEIGITLFGSKEHASKYTDDFPNALQGAPMLLPTKTTTLRRSMEQGWVTWWVAREMTTRPPGCALPDRRMSRPWNVC